MRIRAEQIVVIRADQQFWRDLAAEVGPDRYAEPGPMGDWSFADMAGHLGDWCETRVLTGWREDVGAATIEAAGSPELTG